MFQQLANVLQIILLSASLPLSLIAVKGYRGTPWGKVIEPLPILEAGLILYIIPSFLDLEGAWVFGFLMVVDAVTTIAGVLSGVRLSLLLRRRNL